MATTYELVEYPDRPLKFVRRIVDGLESVIPIEPANSDYQRYLRWLENPNEVEHLTEIPTPPSE
jgi:hypothetical protein